MDNRTAKISIILPNYNGGKHLENCIKCFLDQAYEYKELIIVDGKSIDNSHDTIRSYSTKNQNIVWISEKDNGLSDAINIGINRSNGTIIGYLGSDDLLFHRTLEDVAKTFQTIEFDAVYYDSYTYYINEKRCFYRKCPDLTFTKENLLRYGTIVGLQNIFFKREIYDQYRYNENNKYSMDLELYLELTTKENLLYFYRNIPGTINIQDANISTAMTYQQLKEAYEVALKYCFTQEEVSLLNSSYIGQVSKNQ